MEYPELFVGMMTQENCSSPMDPSKASSSSLEKQKSDADFLLQVFDTKVALASGWDHHGWKLIILE